MAKGSTKAPKKRETKISSVLKELENSKIAYNEVKAFKSKKPTEKEVIERLGGGDTTKGSCASLALAYIGNMAGMDVLDYRGGKSQEFFSSNTAKMLRDMGGHVEKHTDDFVSVNKLTPHIKEGERYLLAAAGHAAIVKRDNGKLFYLELQDPEKNGYHPLDGKAFRKRFGAKRSHSHYGQKYEARCILIETSKVAKDGGLQRLLGYLNTAADKQKKGDKGKKK